jgi:hypothetical protein
MLSNNTSLFSRWFININKKWNNIIFIIFLKFH